VLGTVGYYRDISSSTLRTVGRVEGEKEEQRKRRGYC